MHELFAGRTTIFSRRIKTEDLHCIVQAPAIIVGRGGMVRLRNGRFDWTVQVGHPPPLAETRARRRAQVKAIRMTTEFLQTNIAERNQVNKSKSLSWENITGANRSWQGTRWKACSETRIAPQSPQQCTRNLGPRSSHHKAPRAHWIIGCDQWESTMLSKNAACSGKQDADCRSSHQDYHETTCQFS